MGHNFENFPNINNRLNFQAWARYKQMKSTLESLFKKLKKEDEFYTQETAIILEETNKINPPYNELCKQFSGTTKEYTGLK